METDQTPCSATPDLGQQCLPRSRSYQFNLSISEPSFVAVVDYTTRRYALCNSYTMGCTPVRGDNPRALASGLSYVQVDKHDITILCHLHQCRPCTS